MLYNLNTYQNTVVKKYKWQFVNYPHVKILEDKTIINTLTGRKKKVCVNGYSKGVWITSKTFLTNLNQHIEAI